MPKKEVFVSHDIVSVTIMKVIIFMGAGSVLHRFLSSQLNIWSICITSSVSYLYIVPTAVGKDVVRHIRLRHFCPDPLQYAARALSVAHDCHATTHLSFWTVFLHLVLGWSSHVLLSVLHSKTVTECSSLILFNIFWPFKMVSEIYQRHKSVLSHSRTLR